MARLKLVHFKLKFGGGGAVGVNPRTVGAIIERQEGGTIIRVIGRTEDIVVDAGINDVWEKLDVED
jgi:hypothetical protein